MFFLGDCGCVDVVLSVLVGLIGWLMMLLLVVYDFRMDILWMRKFLMIMIVSLSWFCFGSIGMWCCSFSMLWRLSVVFIW